MDNGIKMTPEQITAFYHALGEVCIKFKIQGVAGLWFGEGEEMGDLIFFNPADTKMRVVCQGICDMFRDYCKANGIQRGERLGNIHDIAQDKADKN